MRHYLPSLAFILISSLQLGCGQPEGSAERESADDSGAVELIQPAPPELVSQLVAILESSQDKLPGAATAELEAFLSEHRGYDTDKLVRSEIAHYRSLAEGRYREARELARGGNFEQAEAMLVDLASHLPDTSDGERAKEHLSYEFYLNQAQHYFVRQRFQEAEQVARALLEKDLTPSQAEPVEQMLDSVGHVGAAMGQAEKASAMSACRQLMVMLATVYVEEGYYPRDLTMQTLDEWDPMSSRSIRRSLSSIVGYRASDGLYSFTAISSSGRHRIKVVDCEIQGVDSR